MKNRCLMDRQGNFAIKDVSNLKGLYFPLASTKGLKSAITPNLCGDMKLDQNHFVLEPTSIEDLRTSKAGRNFWCRFEDGSFWSAAGNSAEAEMNTFSEDRDQVDFSAGFMWQKVERTSKKYGMKSEIISFVPFDKNVEIMQVTLINQGQKTRTIRPVAAVPLYGRSADNLRDHRHVTSLLHRIETTTEGVLVKPTLSFDERGHQKNTYLYYVCGNDGQGKGPMEFFPTVDLFAGQEGTLLCPQAVAEGKRGVEPGCHFEGCEAMGAFAFGNKELAAGEKATYTILIGATENEGEIKAICQQFSTNEQVEKCLEDLKAYWNKEVNIDVKTGSKSFDGFMRWICFQPFLRRIYGCSFLPHHDYGKGGRGWRDLWQDCLALIIMNPEGVRQMILNNFGGVRLDGTNATIIGDKQGEFKADRNGITRVWMDHGMWPFLTTELYINQSGDLGLLNEKVKYFSDRQVMRGEALLEEEEFTPIEHEGTVLEHLILQHVAAMAEKGEHGIIRLRDADWNDALDMASARGESVAFSCAYAGNLKRIAQMVEILGQKEGQENIYIMKELYQLIQGLSVKNGEAAFEEFKKNVSYSFSGETCRVDAKILAEKLNCIADDMIDHIRANEWISDQEQNHWFNSYYDNNGNRVEGCQKGNVRMMLTGQVFAIMSGVADAKQVEAISEAADTYLFDEKIGGYRLNTNFHEEKYDMGRAFGFAYGHKENGAVFSHMAVMYGNALYSRGFKKEGYKALQALADTSMNFAGSQIFPGIPEYFDNDGRGLYHYLTGAASWYALTIVTQVFGLKGQLGDLIFAPQLVAQQLDENQEAGLVATFAGKKLSLTYHFDSPAQMEKNGIKEATIDGKAMEVTDGQVILTANQLKELDDSLHKIIITFN